MSCHSKNTFCRSHKVITVVSFGRLPGDTHIARGLCAMTATGFDRSTDAEAFCMLAVCDAVAARAPESPRFTARGWPT
jgi:hypothetical protein